MATVPIWVAFVAAGIGVLGPVGAQFIAWLVKRSELAQQRELKDMELKEAKLKRLRDERIKAYAELAQLVFAKSTTDPSIDPKILAAYSTITLVGESSETILAAQELCKKTLELRDLARKVDDWEQITEERQGTTNQEYKEADAAVRASFERYITAVRNDIGHPPEATEPIEELLISDPRSPELETSSEG